MLDTLNTELQIERKRTLCACRKKLRKGSKYQQRRCTLDCPHCLCALLFFFLLILPPFTKLCCSVVSVRSSIVNDDSMMVPMSRSGSSGGTATNALSSEMAACSLGKQRYSGSGSVLTTTHTFSGSTFGSQRSCWEVDIEIWPCD